MRNSGKERIAVSLRDLLSENFFWRWLTGTALGRFTLLSTFGAIVLLLTAGAAYYLGVFPTFGQAVWSGVIHFITPSAISNDQSSDARIIGVIQAVSGLVFYVGVLLAVLSQGVASSLDRLASYEAPLRISRHLVFLGGHDTIDQVLQALRDDLNLFHDQSEYLPREAVIVIPRSLFEERDHLREHWDRLAGPIKVHVVAGDIRRFNTLKIASVHRAAKIVVGSQAPEEPALSEDFESVQTLHTLLSYMRHSEVDFVPPIFVTMRRARHAESFVDAPWVKSVHVIAQDRSLGSRLRLAVMHPAFSAVFGIGTEQRVGAIDVLQTVDTVGQSFAQVRKSIPNGLAMGVVRSSGYDELELTMPPHSDYRITSGDMLAVMWNKDEPLPTPPTRPAGKPLRLLLIGWGPTTRELLSELAKHDDPIANITLVTKVTGWRRDLSDGDTPPNVVEIIGNPDYPNVLEKAIADSSPEVIVVASEYSEDIELEDARTTFSALHIRKLVDLSQIPVFTLVTRYSAKHLFESSGMLTPNSSVAAHAQNTAIAVSRYRAGRVVRDIFGSRDVGELTVLDVVDCMAEMDLAPEQQRVKFTQIHDYLTAISKAPMAVYLQSGLLWAPPHGELALAAGDQILVVQHGYGSLTDSAL